MVMTVADLIRQTSSYRQCIMMGYGQVCCGILLVIFYYMEQSQNAGDVTLLGLEGYMCAMFYLMGGLACLTSWGSAKPHIIRLSIMVTALAAVAAFTQCVLTTVFLSSLRQELNFYQACCRDNSANTQCCWEQTNYQIAIAMRAMIMINSCVELFTSVWTSTVSARETCTCNCSLPFVNPHGQVVGEIAGESAFVFTDHITQEYLGTPPPQYGANQDQISTSDAQETTEGVPATQNNLRQRITQSREISCARTVRVGTTSADLTAHVSTGDNVAICEIELADMTHSRARSNSSASQRHAATSDSQIETLSSTDCDPECGTSRSNYNDTMRHGQLAQGCDITGVGMLKNKSVASSRAIEIMGPRECDVSSRDMCVIIHKTWRNEDNSNVSQTYL